MRCALSYDENRSLMEQELSAWGEMQSLTEEPSYKETDIKDAGDKEWFSGYKMACEEFDVLFLNMLEDGQIDSEAYEYLEHILHGNLAMQLFGMLDPNPDANTDE